jgi:hypothetical protein
MGNQHDFPTNLTSEEQFAGFRLRWITNDRRGRMDQPDRVQAVVYVFSNFYRLVKLYEQDRGRTFYELQMFGIFCPTRGWYRPQPDEKPSWHRIKFPQEYRLAGPIQATEYVAKWVVEQSDDEYEPREAPELPLVN